MRLIGVLFCLTLSVVALGQVSQDRVPDSVIDEAVAKVKTGYPHQLDLQPLWSKNPERIIWHYKHANGFLRSRILYSVHANARTITPLVELAIKEKAEDLRFMGATLLAEISHGREMAKRNKLLEPMTRDQSPLVRRIAAKGLRWQDPNAPRILVRMLHDPNRIVRMEAALSLAYLKDRRGIPALVESLDYEFTKEETVWVGAESRSNMVLLRFGMDVIPLLEQKLKNGTAIGKINAITSLKVLNSPKAFEYGLQLIKDKDPRVRIMGYQAVAWERKPEAIPILLDGLSDHGKVMNHSFVDSYIGVLLMGGDSNPKLGHTNWEEGIAAFKKYQAEHPQSKG